MEYKSPHDQLFDLIEEYKISYGYSTMEAITEMRKDLQAKKKNYPARSRLWRQIRQIPDYLIC